MDERNSIQPTNSFNPSQLDIQRHINYAQLSSILKQTKKPVTLNITINDSFNRIDTRNTYTAIESRYEAARKRGSVSGVVAPVMFGMWVMAILAVLTVGVISNDN